MKITNIYLGLLQRELLLALRQKLDILYPLLFFVIVVSLFPLALSPEIPLLRTIGPGIIWVAALLASLLAQDRLLRADYEDGTLEQLLLSRHPLTTLILIKVLAHWLLTGLPIIIMAPLLAGMLYQTAHGVMFLLISLLLGTPSLSLIGAIGSALTLGLRNAGVLLALLILPLLVPILIFGASAAAGSAAIGVSGQLALLGAFLILALILAPIAIVGALRVAV